MPFRASAVRFGFSRFVIAPPAAPASVTFSSMGGTFANFTVAAVTGATLYTVNVYRATTLTNTGGTLVGTWTSSTTSVNVPFNYSLQFPANGSSPYYYYLTATCSKTGSTQSPAVTSSQICTMIGYTGANYTWTSPFTGTVTICLSGGGGTGQYNQGSGGNGGLLVATYGVTASTGYTVAVGGGGEGAFTTGLTGAWGGISGASSGGNGFCTGAGCSQFQTLMYAGGGGGGGYSTNICDSGNGGLAGDGGSSTAGSGTAGLNYSPASGGGGGGTTSAVGSGGAGAGGGGAGAAGVTGRGGNGGSGATTQGSGGGGGYRGGGGSGGLSGGRGPTGGGGGGSSFATGVTVLQNVLGGAFTGIPDTRATINGFPGCCAIFW